jgi:hypothetical protein
MARGMKKVIGVQYGLGSIKDRFISEVCEDYLVDDTKEYIRARFRDGQPKYGKYVDDFIVQEWPAVIPDPTGKDIITSMGENLSKEINKDVNIKNRK